jgi:hypothetical protein
MPTMSNGAFIANTGPRVAAVMRAIKTQAPGAAKFLKDREKRSRKADGVRRAAHDHFSELNEKVRDLRSLVAQIQKTKAEAPSGAWAHDDELRLTEAQSDLADVTAERDALRPPETKPNEEQRNASRQRTRRVNAMHTVIPTFEGGLHGWLEAQSPTIILEDYLPDLPEPASSELLAKIRADIDAVADKITALDSAARPSKEFERTIDAFIAEHAKAGAPNSSYALFGVPKVRQQDQRRYGRIRPPLDSIFLGDTRSADVQLGFSALCWLFPKEVKKQMLKDAGERIGGRVEMTDAERAAAIEKVGVELVELQRLEELVIRELENFDDVAIPRLGGRHVEALLGIRVTGKKPAPPYNLQNRK